MPKVLIIAGPNGAGKTTFARQFLPNEAETIQFVNADLIAAGISPFAPASADVLAGRTMLERLNSLADEGQDFALETTLSGTWLRKHVLDWQSRNYAVKVYYLRLSRVELSIHRVKHRVSLGGHNIPEVVIRRRFDRSLHLLESIYTKLVDDWVVYDNDGDSILSGGKADKINSETERLEHLRGYELALRAMRRGVRNACLNGTAYDPDGSRKVFWETHDEAGNPIEN